MPFQTRQRLTWAGVCVLVGVCMLASPAASQPPDPLALQVQLEQVQKLQQAIAEELKTQNKELQERLKAQETALLETQRKSIDWWFSLLGAMVGALAVMFGALPLLLTRHQKADIDKDLTSAKELLASIRGHEQQARDATEKLNSYVSGQPQSAAQQVEINREIASIQSSTTATDTDKLRARAIQASEVDNPTTAQAMEAFDLWKALTLLAPQDASAQFNAGYWAQQLHRQSAKPGKTHWFEVLVSFYSQAMKIKLGKPAAANNWGSALDDEAQAIAAQDLGAARVLWQQAGEKYAQALKIKPDMHEAATNWGSALSQEAQAVAAQELDAARVLWKQAGDKYAQALAIKPDDHDVANNWGIALDKEAQAVAPRDLDAARALWKQAGDKYAQALAIKPDDHDVANNWGIALDAEAQAVAAQDLDAARVLWKQAGDKYALALKIKSDTHEAANNWGSALDEEAQAVAAQDLGAARALWQQAGEKYAQALKIKPDNHEAANNWGGALAAEAQALLVHQLKDDADQVLVCAATLLEQHIAAWPDARGQLAYNLACVYSLQERVAEAVAQLEAARQADELPDHWPTDPDLNPIRTSAEYQAWVSQHFPNPIPTDTNASKGT